MLITYPHDKETEYAALGAMFLDAEAAKRGVDTLTASDFYDTVARSVFETMQKVYVQNEPVDAALVGVELAKRDDNQGMSALPKIMGSYFLPSNMQVYCERLQKLSAFRKLIKSCHTIMSMASKEDDQTLEFAQQVFGQICRTSSFSVGPRHVKDILGNVLANLEARFNGEEEVLTSGFYDLDTYLTGFRPSEYIIVAARPSMGKTTFAQNIAEQLALKQVPVLLLSLEMSAERLLERSIANIGNMDGQLLRLGHKSLDWDKISDTVTKLSELPLYIDDMSRTLADIKTSCRKAVTEYGVRLVILDYIGLIEYTLPTRTREQEVATISRHLKGLANELKVPLIVLSQLSRENTKRSEKTPQLSDLRDSGALEQDADVVLFLHRPDYYGEKDKRGVAQVIIAKQRNGPTGIIELGFDASRTRFYNLEKWRLEK